MSLGKLRGNWTAWRGRLRLDELDWVEELLYLNMGAMEACVAYSWYLLVLALAQSLDRALPFWGACLLFWGPYLVASLVYRTGLPADRRQALVAGLMIVTVLIAVRLSLYGDYGLGDLGWVTQLTDRLFDAFSVLPPDLALLVLVFVGWWRGIVLSRKDYDTLRVGFHFRLGIILLLAYFFVAILARQANVNLVILAHFFFGLMSIALARMLDVGGIHRSTLGSKQWVGVLVGASLGSLSLALLVSFLFSRQILLAVIARIRPLWNLFGRLLWYFIGALLYLLFPLMEWLFLLLEQLRRSLGSVENLPFASPLQSPLEPLQQEEMQAWFPYCNTILIILLIVVGLLLVARLIRRALEEQARRGDLERESLWSGQALLDDLKKGLQQGLNRLRAFVDQFGDRKRRSAASIRKIYASMVDLAGEAGYGRRPAETPYEYRSVLYRAFPGGQEPVDAITEAYVRVHYGEVPDTREEMARIVRYWELVQTLVVPKDEPQQV